MKTKKIGLTQIVTFLLIAAAIILGVHLNQKSQTFTPKADLTATTIQFLDTKGQPLAQAGNPLVEIKLSFVPSSSGVFPTNFRIANDTPSNLTNADQQVFNQNDKIVNWVLSPGSGPKNVFVQFKVSGAWQDYLSASLQASAPQATYQLSTKVATASVGQTVAVSWKSTEGNPTDWIGLYQSSAPDSKYLDMVYTNCSKDKTTTNKIILQGSCSFTIPANAPVGNYEFRMFSSGGLAQLGASGSFKVQ